MASHKHDYVLLDVEKRKDTSSRWSNSYYRTTRLNCTLCGEIKEKKEVLNKGLNEERPDWTYNI